MKGVYQYKRSLVRKRQERGDDGKQIWYTGYYNYRQVQYTYPTIKARSQVDTGVESGPLTTGGADDGDARLARDCSERASDRAGQLRIHVLPLHNPRQPHERPHAPCLIGKHASIPACPCC